MSQYKVMVDDNFHYMDEDERYELGTFATAEEAIAACRKLVDEWLSSNHKPGMTADELFAQFASFGEEPFIIAVSPAGKVDFSARDYVHERAPAICGRGPA
jgi:hypothetical protein